MIKALHVVVRKASLGIRENLAIITVVGVALGRLIGSMGGRAASSAVSERREHVSWPGIDALARSRSRSSLVGSMANG